MGQKPMALSQRPNITANIPPPSKYWTQHCCGQRPISNKTKSPQWLVPSDFVILFQTLYLPTGFFIGRRFTSFSVTAS